MSIIIHIGKPGSFSHAAARIQYGVDHTYMGCKSFADVFKHVSEGNAEIGVIPIENSLAGSIYENYDLFNTYPVQIVGEQYLKVEHYLLGKKSDVPHEERLHGVKTVYSHPKALEQCRLFFEKHPWMKPTVANDTATAAYEVASSQDMSLAAIGSMESAHLYRLEVLQSNIEDDRHNYTRFVYITKGEVHIPNADKCSLQIEVKHKPGSLVEVLHILKDQNLNMTKIESRPVHGKPFEYRFYLDFEFPHAMDLQRVLSLIVRSSQSVRVLGVYRAAALEI